MSLDEALDEPGFYILGGLGTAAVLVGWIISKKSMEFSLPIWQLLILIVGILVASAFFATKD